MKHARSIVALLATTLLSSMGVASAAAALPELTRPGTTSELSSKATTWETEGAIIFETSEGTKFSCEKASSAGKVKGVAEFSETIIKFVGCGESLFKSTCQSTATPGEIKTVALSGRIAYINKALPEVGLKLAPTTGTTLATFECPGGFLKDELRGAMIGVFGKGEQNKSVTSLKLVYERGETAGQRPDEICRSRGIESVKRCTGETDGAAQAQNLRLAWLGVRGGRGS